jgi:hypothetical protein
MLVVRLIGGAVAADLITLALYATLEHVVRA